MFLFPVRQKSLIIVFPVFLGYSWAFILPHNLWSHSIQFFFNHPVCILIWIKLNLYRTYGRTDIFMVLNIPVQEHSMACSFPDLIFKASRRFNPFYVSILYFICFTAINSIQYYSMFKILPVLSLTKTLRALYLSVQCNCCMVLHAKNISLFIHLGPWRWAISLCPFFSIFLYFTNCAPWIPSPTSLFFMCEDFSYA